MPQAVLLIAGKLAMAYGAYVDIAIKIGGAIGLSAGTSTLIANAVLNLAITPSISAATRPESE